jgi:hypothetical protein
MKKYIKDVNQLEQKKLYNWEQDGACNPYQFIASYQIKKSNTVYFLFADQWALVIQLTKISIVGKMYLLEKEQLTK